VAVDWGVTLILAGTFDAAVALAALLLPLRSRPAALAAASKTGDIAMALACSDLGQKAITFSAIQDAAGQDVAAAAADDDYVAVASGPGTQKKIKPISVTSE